MKPFFLFIFFVCFGLPCFSQNANSERFKGLSDNMGRTLENSKANLEDFDQDAGDSKNMRSYSHYRDRYESLSTALRDSEQRLDKLIRTYDRTERIKTERDQYAELIQTLESTKTDYDNWLKSVQ